jgi:HPt (histidine-containing phosphotransfer) domain-containing protein
MSTDKTFPSPGLAPVDRAHLARYTRGDERLEREVLDLFIAHVPRTLAQLRAATTERDWFVSSHTLKGSAAAVGAWRVAALASDAEKLADAKSDERAAVIAGLEAAAREVEAYVAAALPPVTA